MSPGVARLILVMLVSCFAVVHSAEESERVAKELAARLLSVTPLDAGWKFAKATSGKLDNGKQKTAYFYANGAKRRLLTISIIEQGHIPTDDAEAAVYVKRFEDLGYTITGFRFIPAKRNTFLIEEQSREFKGATTVSTLIFIQGDGEIYNVTATIIDDRSTLAERMRIISQVSCDGVALSGEFIGLPKE